MFTVAKQYKRLVILNCDGAVVYSPPNFLKAPNRQPFAELAARLSAGANYIREVMAFEARFHPDATQRIVG